MSHGLSIYEASRLQTSAYRNLRQAYSRALAEFNLSPPEWTLLGVLIQQSGESLRLTDIARRLAVKPPFVTTLVEKLCRRGLVKRLDDPDDRRVKRVAISAAGQTFARKVDKSVQRRLDQFTAGITAADMKVYFRVLRKLSQK